MIPITDSYPLIAQTIYLTVASMVVGVSLCVLLAADREEREDVYEPWLFWTAPILLIQLLTTLVAVLIYAFGGLSSMLLTIVLAQWIVVVLGVAVLPGGLILARRTKRKRRPRRGEWFATVAASTIAVLGFSVIWMYVVALVVQPTQSTHFDELVKTGAGILILVPIALLAAPLEEAVYRLGLQGMLQSLEKKGWCPWWATIVVPSAIWALGHAGVLTPHGIKEFQIFVVGLVLGLVYRRYGFGACVAVHLGLNCGALALAPLEWLIFHGD